MSRDIRLGRAGAGPYTEAVFVPSDRSLLFTAGLIARDAAGDIVAPGDTEAQIRHIFGQIGDIAARVGATLADVIKITIYLQDIQSDLDTIRRLRSEYWPTDPPASIGVEISGLMSDDLCVEIEAIVLVPAD
jgi:2-iminobutanoate/2-iminopropanoate deaminase